MQKDTKFPHDNTIDFCLVEGTSFQDFITSPHRSFKNSKRKINAYLGNKRRTGPKQRESTTLSLPKSLLTKQAIGPAKNAFTFSGELPGIRDLLVAFQKPSGMHGHPLFYEEEQTALNFLRSFGVVNTLDFLSSSAPQESGLLYRLDSKTSGLMLYCNNLKLHRRLRDLVKDQKIQKVYLAVVEGAAGSAGLLRNHLIPSGEKGRMQKVLEGVDLSSTNSCSLYYERIGHDPNTDQSALMISLREGKRHQIRAQLQSAGLPIVGDELYGNGTSDTELKLHAFSYIFPEFVFQHEVDSQDTALGISSFNRGSIKRFGLRGERAFWCPCPKSWHLFADLNGSLEVFGDEVGPLKGSQLAEILAFCDRGNREFGRGL